MFRCHLEKAGMKMPVITLDIVPFLSEDQKAQLVKEFTDSASKVT